MSNNQSIAIQISIDAKTDELKVIQGQFEALGKGLNKTANDMSNFKNKVDILAHSTQAFIGSATIARQVFSTMMFPVQQTLDLADSLSKLSQKTGISTDGLYSLSSAAKLSDVNFASLESALAKFSKGIGEASMGTGDAKKAFESLGISIKNSDGTLKNSFTLLTELADSFQDMPDGATKATTAIQLFGKSGANIIPLLNSGSEALKEYLGVMDDKTGKAAEAFNDSMTKIGLALESVGLSFVKDFSPSIQSMTEDIESVAKSIQSFSSNTTINYYETFKKYADDVAALGVALYGTPLLLKSTSNAFSSLSSSTMLAAAKMALYGNKLESAIAKTHMAKTALSGLSVAFKTFAPTAILFGITEIFLNWDKITGNIKTNLVSSATELEKMTNNQLMAQFDALNKKIQETNEEIQKLSPKSKGFSYFGTTSEEEKTAAKAQIDTLQQQKEAFQGLIDKVIELRKQKNESSKDTTKQEQNFKNNFEAEIKNIEKLFPKQYTSDVEGQKLKLFARYEEAKLQIHKDNTEALKLLEIRRDEELAIINKEAQKKTLDEAKRLQEDWAKRSYDITYETAIAQQDEMSKPYIELQHKYDEDVKKYSGIQGAKEKLTEDYNAKLIALNIKTVDEFNKSEEEKNKKSAEWQVKLFDASEKLNDELLTQQAKMYGDDSQTQIDAWYNSQLYWLGELSIQGQATGEELEKLLRQIDEIKDLKLKEQTLFFKMEQGFFNSFEDNLSNSIEDAFNKKLDLKTFLRNIGDDLIGTFSKASSRNIMSALSGTSGGSFNIGSLLGLAGTSIVGSTLSASDLSSIASQSGTIVDEYSGIMQTAGGTVIDATGKVTSGGTDAMSLISTVGTLKTAFDVVSGGVSSMVSGAFGSIANGLGSIGLDSAGTWVSQFGGGFANPFTTSWTPALSGSSTGMGAMAGGTLMGAGLGYGVGSLGDMLFGADTKAGIGGAIGGAGGALLGSQIGAIGGPVGMAVGALLGSVIGGMFGSTKLKETGFNFTEDIFGTIDTSLIQSYEDWQKKSWFSSKSWTDYKELSGTEKSYIEGMFTTYQYLFDTLENGQDIWLEAGKYTNEELTDQLARNFVEGFTEIPQFIQVELEREIPGMWSDFNDNVGNSVVGAMETYTSNESNPAFTEMYAAWTTYAESVDKTVMQALSEAVSQFVTSKREFEIWGLENEGNTVRSLQMQAGWASQDFANLAESMGVTGVTIDNFLTMYEDAVKNSFTPETIAQWDALGDSLMSAADASKAYQDALEQTKQAEAELEAYYNTDRRDFDSARAQSENYRNALLEQGKALEALTAGTGMFIKMGLSGAEMLAKSAQSSMAYVSTNALQLQNAMESFWALAEYLPQNVKSNETWSPVYEVFAKEIETFANDIGTASGVMRDFSEVVSAVNPLAEALARSSLMDKYSVGGVGVGGIYQAQLYQDYVSEKGTSSITGDRLRGEDVIGYDKALYNLSEQMKTGEITADSYQMAIDTLNTQYGDIADLWGDSIAQINRVTESGIAVHDAANASVEYYFSQITLSAQNLGMAFAAANAPIAQVIATIGRLNSLSGVLNYSISAGASGATGAKAETIAAAAEMASSTLTTASSAEAASALQGSSSFSGLSSTEFRDLTLLLDGVSAYNSTGFEVAFTRINAALIEDTINQQQYNELFKYALDTTNDTQARMAASIGGGGGGATIADNIASIKDYTEDIAEYQRQLLQSDSTTPLSLSDRYFSSRSDLKTLLSEAEGYAVANDGEKFKEAFDKVKDLGSDFLDLSKDFVANNEGYLADFTLLYSSLERMKTLTVDGSHASGLSYVPFDGYIAELHKGERVQTASEVRGNDALAQEIKALRADLKAANSSIAQHTAKTAKILDRWDYDGQPDVRAV